MEHKAKNHKNKTYYKDAWKEKRGRLILLHLNGSAYEMGYQHGILLKQEIKKGAIQFYADPVNGDRKSYSPRDLLIKFYLNRKVYIPAKKSQPQEIIDQLHGISDGSGLAFKTVFKGHHHTSVGMILLPQMAEKEIKLFNKIDLNLNSCSSFVAMNHATKDGKIVFGRNTDYCGINLFPQFPTIAFFEPDDGYRHVQIGTAGILWTSGMNEKGIVACIHYMFFDNVSASGWGFPAFMNYILHKASSIEEAITILKSNPRAASCGFIITDAKKKAAVAVEMNSDKVIVRKMQSNRLVMTNMAVSPQMKQDDFIHKYRINEGTYARYERLMQLIKENYGKIDPALAATFMGDSIRFPLNTERSVYGVLPQSHNINSVIYSPEELKFWVAQGPAPVCHNNYIGFDFKREIQGKSASMYLPRLKPYVFKNKNKKYALNKYINAYILFEKNPKLKAKIMQLLYEAAENDPEEIVYKQMITKYLILSGKYEKALSVIEQTLCLKQSLNENAHSKLLLAIIYDLKKSRKKATELYKRIIQLQSQVNQLIVVYAKKYLKKAFTKRDFKDRPLIIDFSQSSGIE